MQIDSDIDIHSGKYVCRCIRRKENLESKELPILPHEQRPNAFYERQINGLQEQLVAAEEAVEIEREEIAKFQEKSEEWSERQKQELLGKIKDLEAEVARLKRENGEAKVGDVNKLFARIKELEKEIKQLKKLNSIEKLETKIEQPPKTKPWKQLFNKK